MSKARNTVFVLVCLLSFFSVAICLVCLKAPPPLPLSEPFDFILRTRSVLEAKRLQEAPDISLPLFLDKKFQEESDLFLSTHFPGGAVAPLANAALQRTSIMAANTIFNFDTYWTFFGSPMVYSREHNALYQIPAKIHSGLTMQMTESVERFSRLTKNGRRAVVFLVAHPAAKTLNPVHKYVSNPLTAKYYEDNFVTPFSKTGIPTILYDPKDTNGLLLNGFNTDSHWTICGAYDAYRMIAQELGLNALVPSSTVSFEQYFFIGELSRFGLYYFDNGDCIEDYVFEYPPFEMIYDGRSLPDGHPYEEGRGTQQYYRNGTAAYADYLGYFGQNINAVLLYRQEQYDPDKGKLLLLTDSYGTPVEKMFASHYNETHVVMPTSLKEDFDIESYADENDIDDIVVLAGHNKILDKAWISSL